MSSSSQRTMVVVPSAPAFEGDQAVALERPVVADGVAVRALELGDRDRVGDGDAEDPDVGLAGHPDADRDVARDPDVLHLGHPDRLAGDVAQDVPCLLDPGIDDDHRMDRLRLPVLGLVAEDPVEGVADAGPDDRQPDRAADHRITVRHIPTPAASSSSMARAPSPGLRLTGAHASVRTCVSKPRRRASSAVALMQ